MFRHFKEGTDTYRHTYMALDTLHVRQKSKRLGEMVKYFFAKHTHTHTHNVGQLI